MLLDRGLYTIFCVLFDNEQVSSSLHSQMLAGLTFHIPYDIP